MANQELESKTVELGVNTLESITFSLMAREVINKLPLTFKTGEGDIFIELRNGVLLEGDPQEAYEEDVHVPLYEKLMSAGLFIASLRSVENQASVSVDLTEKEIDYLNELYLGRMRKQEIMSRQEIENPSVQEIVRIIKEASKSRVRTPMTILEESREVFMELNLLWNKAGGTPRSSFLEFNG